MSTAKDVMWAAVKRRAARLARLVELDGPNYVLVRELLLVQEALAGYDPEAYGVAVAARASEAARQRFGICKDCDNMLEPQPRTHCNTCLESVDDPDEEEPT